MRSIAGVALAGFLLGCGVAAPAAAGPARVEVVTVGRNDFPEGVTPDGAIFDVTVRYELADDGSVSACHVTRSSNNPVVDQASCDILLHRARPPRRGASRRERMQFLWWGADWMGADNPRGAPLPISSHLWLSQGDYPMAALMARRQGIVEFEARVSAVGFVLDCEVVTSSGTEALDRGTCELVSRRGRFIPAVDGNGRRREGLFRGRVIWRIAQ